ncbi:MAG: PAS domain S-box protein [Candidatus Reddybacter sp.]
MKKNDASIVEKTTVRNSLSTRMTALIVLLFALESILLFVILSAHIKSQHIDDKKQDIQYELIRLQENLGFLALNNEASQIQRSVALLAASTIKKTAILIDDKAKILAGTRIEFINRNVNDINIADNYIVDHNFKPYIKKYLEAIKSNPKNLVWLSEDGASIFGITPIMLGRLSSSSLKTDKIGAMIIHYDMKGIAVESQVLANQLIIPMLIILALIGLLTATYFNYWISQRIKLVSESAKNFMGSGDHIPIKVRSKDEIGDLGHAYNTMAEAANNEHQRLEHSENNLAITLNSIGDAVITTDTQGNITRMNPVAEQLTGYLLKDCQGEIINNVFSIIDSSTRQVIANPVEKVIATGETVSLSNHTTLISKDGTEYHISDSAAAIKNSNGDIHGMVLIFNDINEEYRLRTKLRDTLYRASLHWKESPLGMIEWNIDFEFVDINPAAEKIFSLKKEDIIGKHTSKWFNINTLNTQMNKSWEELINSRIGRHDINTIITPDQRTIICEWYCTPLINGDGNIIGVSSLVMDITEQRRLQNLENNNQKGLQQLLDGMLIMLATLKPDGTIIFVNKAPLKALGISLSDVIGSKLWDTPWFSHSNHQQERIKNDCRQASSAKKIERELEITTSMGTSWIDYNIHPVFDERGEVSYLVVEGSDANARKRAEQHLIRNQKMQALSQIVGGIAHDYNNMLGVIVGYSGLLKRRYSKVEGAIKFVDEIIHAANRGKILTQKMLNFSGPESSDPHAIVINTSIDNMKDALAKSLTSAIRLKCGLSDKNWLSWVDNSELEDVILNLVINAKHAMPEGGLLTLRTENIHLKKTEATILSVSGNDYIKLSITDTGSGIDNTLLEKIFEPFYSTKGKGGNGLGLSQAYAFMKRSGGAISVTSELGKGTQFDLYFPRHQSLKDEKPILSNLDNATINGHENILVVDDEPALRYLAREILQDAGYTALTASNGEEALATLATKQNIALVLSDVVMPDMDGFSLAREIQSRYPAVKIQLISGFVFDHPANNVNFNLANNILTKPYSSSELLKRLRLLLDNSSDRETHHE